MKAAPPEGAAFVFLATMGAYSSHPPMSRFALVVAALLLLPVWVCAQTRTRGPEMDSSTGGKAPGIAVLNIPGKPFSARTMTDWTHTLTDGSTVTLHLEAFIARDSQGRVYRENHHFAPASSHDPGPLEAIHLYDPVSRTKLLCDGRTHRCNLLDYEPQTFFDLTPEGTYNNGTSTLKREQLGTDLIEGIPVLHTLETTTVATQAIGNDRPYVSSREFWYCDELETNLGVTRTDPIQGKQVVRLFQIDRGEPDPHLWDVPIGFKVVDMRAPALRHR
jgi:hypothetical protein